MSAVTSPARPAAATTTSAVRVRLVDVLDPGVHDRHRRVAPGPLEREQERQRPPDGEPAPDDHDVAGPRPGRRRRRAAPRCRPGVHGSGPGAPITSRPRLIGWSPSTSLSGSTRSRTRVLVDAPRAAGSWTRIDVDRGVGVEPVDHRLDLGLARPSAGEVDVEGLDADLGAVARASSRRSGRSAAVVADEHRPQPDGARPAAAARAARSASSILRRPATALAVEERAGIPLLVAEVSFAGEHHDDTGRVGGRQRPRRRASSRRAGRPRSPRRASAPRGRRRTGRRRRTPRPRPPRARRPWRRRARRRPRGTAGRRRSRRRRRRARARSRWTTCARRRARRAPGPQLLGARRAPRSRTSHDAGSAPNSSASCTSAVSPKVRIERPSGSGAGAARSRVALRRATRSSTRRLGEGRGDDDVGLRAAGDRASASVGVDRSPATATTPPKALTRRRRARARTPRRASARPRRRDALACLMMATAATAPARRRRARGRAATRRPRRRGSGTSRGARRAG